MDLVRTFQESLTRLLGPAYRAVQAHYQLTRSKRHVYRLAGVGAGGDVIHLSNRDFEPLIGLDVIEMPLDGGTAIFRT